MSVKRAFTTFIAGFLPLIPLHGHRLLDIDSPFFVNHSLSLHWRYIPYLELMGFMGITLFAVGAWLVAGVRSHRYAPEMIAFFFMWCVGIDWLRAQYAFDGTCH